MAIFNLDYNALWQSICQWSRKAGRVATRPALIMWYVMKSPDTARADKIAIYASLAYLILPIDIISARRFPIIGWLDEVISMAVLLNKMAKYITPELRGPRRRPARPMVRSRHPGRLSGPGSAALPAPSDRR